MVPPSILNDLPPYWIPFTQFLSLMFSYRICTKTGVRNAKKKLDCAMLTGPSVLLYSPAFNTQNIEEQNLKMDIKHDKTVYNPWISTKVPRVSQHSIWYTNDPQLPSHSRTCSFERPRSISFSVRCRPGHSDSSAGGLQWLSVKYLSQFGENSFERQPLLLV